MDPKDTWPVVKFLVAATGLKRRDARKMLEEIPKACHGDLFLRARRWDRDVASKASEELTVVLGDKANLPTLIEATRRAMTAAHLQDTDEHEEDATPRPRKTRRK